MNLPLLNLFDRTAILRMMVIWVVECSETDLYYRDRGNVK
jgi:hypothetical protein